MFKKNLLALSLLTAFNAYAVNLDKIDTAIVDGKIIYTISFDNKISYLRHAPMKEGKELRVFIRSTENQFKDNVIQDSIFSQKIKDIPTINAVYPDINNNGLLINFKNETVYDVRPGSDGRTLKIIVPFSLKQQLGLDVIKDTLTAIKGEIVKAANDQSGNPEKEIILEIKNNIKQDFKEIIVEQKPVKNNISVSKIKLIVANIFGNPDFLVNYKKENKIEEDKNLIFKKDKNNKVVKADNVLETKVEVLPSISIENNPNQEIIAESTVQKTQEAINSEKRDLDKLSMQADLFIKDAQLSITNRDYPKALNRLGRVLSMPSNDKTEEAQSLVGDVRRFNGEMEKAKAEYEAYLKVFPEGVNAKRIKDLIAAENTWSKDVIKAKVTRRPDEKPAEWTVSGNASAYHYSGQSEIETLTPPPPGQLTFDQQKLSAIDQDSLVSQINLTARKRDSVTDTRVVYRQTQNSNNLDHNRDYSRVYSAYFERTDKENGYFVRLGRQNPSGNGAMSRFDGFQGSYEVKPDWRVGSIGGTAVEFMSPYKKDFQGFNVEYVGKLGKPGVSLYSMQENLDGMPNRSAVGADLRYYTEKFNAFGTYDYDILYNATNIAMGQVNYSSDHGVNYFASFDHRRAPSLGLSTAILSAPGMTLTDIINNQGLDATRKQVLALSAISDMADFGFTKPINDKWQIGGDYRVSQISSTEPVNVSIPLGVIGTCLGIVDPVNNMCNFNTDPQSGSGVSQVFTVQLVGSNLWNTSGVVSANYSYILAPSYYGHSASVSLVYPINDIFRLDTNLRYYQQNGTQDNSYQTRIAPSVKLTADATKNVHFELEVGAEQSESFMQDRKDKSLRQYLYTGLRTDF